MKNIRGFTLLELLVVVLIIGILSAIAMPQYQKAVAKAKVTSVLPSMKRWKDALMEYKLANGSYCKEGTEEECKELPDASDVDANWPSDWNDGKCGNSNECSNDYWDCFTDSFGAALCDHQLPVGGRRHYHIILYQPDEPYHINFRDKTICGGFGPEMHDFCRGLGGTLAEEDGTEYILFSLHGASTKPDK